MAGQTFAELQAQFRSIWPTVTLRSIGDVEANGRRRPLDQLRHPRSAHARLTCVRGAVPLPRPQPLARAAVARDLRDLAADSPRVLDYYFSLVPELDTPEARQRFEAVSLVDGRNEPLSRKLLARPGALERIRRLIGEPEVAMIIPFCMTSDEVGLAEALQLPIYGSDPALNWLGSKTGSRSVFADEGVQHPAGLDVRSSDDLADCAVGAPRAEPVRDLGRAQARSGRERPRERAARSRRSKA